MRNNTLIGIGVAAAILVVVFIASRFMPTSHPVPAPALPRGPSLAEIQQAAQKVTAGFIGNTKIGEYNVGCAKSGPGDAPGPVSNGAVPFTLNASGTGGTPAPTTATLAQPSTAATPPPEPTLKLGRCRAALLVRASDKKHSVVLIAVFRTVENDDSIAMILHTAPIAKVGTKVIVALADKKVIGLPVASCEKNQCIALGILKSKVYPQLVSRPKLVVVVPVAATGQRMIIPLSTSGLSQSIDAMKRAG